MSRVFQPHVITDDSALGGSFVEGSLRFDGSGDHFIRTPSSEGNRRRFTISLWAKRSLTGVYQAFIGHMVITVIVIHLELMIMID